MSEHLLDVKHLQTVFHMGDGLVRAVDDATFHVDEGEIIGIVGESGSGKSVTMMSILKLIAMPPGEIVGGEAIFQGRDILKYGPTSEEIREIRGGGISMIFQEPMTSLNPVLTVGQQIMESIMLHLKMNKADARKRTIELLGQVGIPDAESRIDYYPTQFSGGMRQRVMIAMAMSCDPKILIADEATTALDVTTQEQILELLRDIVKKTNTALIIITHNLSIIARYAERIYVMYAGNIVERGTSEELFVTPAHPYTMGLLRAIPRLDSDKSRRLVSIDGTPPNPAKKTGRCPFYDRCLYREERCDINELPEYIEYSETQASACRFRREELLAKAPPEAKEANRRSIGKEPVLQLKGLSKYYPVTQGIARRKVGDVKALDDVDLTIYQGETVGLVGESGCGKTTLAKTVLRLHPATGGEIIFRGEDITNLPERKLNSIRRDVQFIFQDPYGSLDPRQTAGSVVGEAIKTHKLAKDKADYERRIDELFRAVGLDPALKNRAPHEFSGGQRQRLCIARALIKKPKVLILDDSTSAVDTATDARIRKAMREFIPGTTKIIIAQRISSVESADRVIVMDEGRVSGFDTPANLLKNNSIYKDVYETQMAGGGDFDMKGGEK